MPSGRGCRQCPDPTARSESGTKTRSESGETCNAKHGPPEQRLTSAEFSETWLKRTTSRPSTIRSESTRDVQLFFCGDQVRDESGNWALLQDLGRCPHLFAETYLTACRIQVYGVWNSVFLLSTHSYRSFVDEVVACARVKNIFRGTAPRVSPKMACVIKTAPDL